MFCRYLCMRNSFSGFYGSLSFRFVFFVAHQGIIVLTSILELKIFLQSEHFQVQERFLCYFATCCATGSGYLKSTLDSERKPIVCHAHVKLYIIPLSTFEFLISYTWCLWCCSHQLQILEKTIHNFEISTCLQKNVFLDAAWRFIRQKYHWLYFKNYQSEYRVLLSCNFFAALPSGEGFMCAWTADETQSNRDSTSSSPSSRSVESVRNFLLTVYHFVKRGSTTIDALPFSVVFL